MADLWREASGASMAGAMLLALFIDALIGDPPALWRRLPHPVSLIGTAIARLDKSLNLSQKSFAARKAMGVLTVALLVAASVLFGVALSWLAAEGLFGQAVGLAAIWALLAQKSLYLHVRDVALALQSGSVEPGRDAVSKIVGRDVSELDQAGVSRAAIESLFENFSDAVAAPVFWFLVLGFPGLLALKTVNTMDSMIGHKSERYLAFGWAAARLDDLMMWAPARLSGALLVAAAFILPGCSGPGAAKIMRRDHNRHASPNAGWPESAGAGALGVALAGPRRYKGVALPGVWLGDGEKGPAGPDDIFRALSLMAVACLLLWLLVAILWLLCAKSA